MTSASRPSKILPFLMQIQHSVVALRSPLLPSSEDSYIKVSRANRKKLTKVHVIDGGVVIRLEKTAQIKEKAEEEKVQARVARAKAKARKSQEESSGKDISRANASEKQKAKVSKKVTIIISDGKGEKFVFAWYLTARMVYEIVSYPTSVSKMLMDRLRMKASYVVLSIGDSVKLARTFIQQGDMLSILKIK
ncbi:hypothetical protein K440DRAFT_678353 [Wilcoxina mikolae CBS 423.85]|nr:hypothetical protein K440DRAFT_678353 [Wilcoxina mikolae CBS 423.85]